MKKIRIYGIICMMLLITACSSDNSLTEDGKYLVCSSSVISHSGVLILNPQGEKVLELPDSCIEHRISQDGFIMQPEIGEIPATDRLMITSSVSENEATVGIWDVEKECWLIEPQPGWPALSWMSVNGQLELKECYLGDKIYDKDFNCSMIAYISQMKNSKKKTLFFRTYIKPVRFLLKG